MIYFVQAGPDRRIKIGTSKCVPGRIEIIRNASPYPVEVLLVCEGGRDEEARLHSKFQKHRIYREWFEPHEVILAEIEALRGAGSLPALVVPDLNAEKVILMQEVDMRIARLGVSRTALCLKAKVSATVMSRWALHRRAPSLPTIGKLESAIAALEAERAA